MNETFAELKKIQDERCDEALEILRINFSNYIRTYKEERGDFKFEFRILADHFASWELEEFLEEKKLEGFSYKKTGDGSFLSYLIYINDGEG